MVKRCQPSAISCAAETAVRFVGGVADDVHAVYGEGEVVVKSLCEDPQSGLVGGDVEPAVSFSASPFRRTTLTKSNMKASL
jgi:hypothetical protein